MPIRRTKHNPGTRFWLAPSQYQTVHDVANGLPNPLRHSFLMRVSKVLQLTEQHGPVADALVSRAIDAALRELQVVA